MTRQRTATKEQARKWRETYKLKHPDRRADTVRRYKQRRYEKGLCRQCPNQRVVNSVLCTKCQDKKWRANGKFTTRRRESHNNGQMACIVEMKMSPILHPHWKEVEPWIMEHIDIFVDPTDQALRHSTDIAAFEDRI